VPFIPNLQPVKICSICPISVELGLIELQSINYFYFFDKLVKNIEIYY